MEKQLVKINFPEIKLVIGDSVIRVLDSCTIEADSAKEIKSAIKGRIPRGNIFGEMKQKMIEELKKGVDIELADGTVVNLAMNHQHGWMFDIPISTSMLNKAKGQHVPVTYANFVHNGLYKLKNGNSILQEAREELMKLTSSKAEEALIKAKEALIKIKKALIRSVSQKAKATLIELGYIKNGDYAITVQGQDALDRLARIDPSTDPSCRMKLTRAMFCIKDPTLPAFEWAKNNSFIEYVKADATPRQPWYVEDKACWYPTKIGAAWLEKNAKKILRHHSASKTRKVEMIPFMPLGHLNEYLSSPDKDTRDLAERRLQVIKGPKRR